MKVRTKLNLILVLVILLVALGGTVSVKDMEDVKDKALETMEASSRWNYLISVDQSGISRLWDFAMAHSGRNSWVSVRHF